MKSRTGLFQYLKERQYFKYVIAAAAMLAITIYACSVELASSPGTFAWFNSTIEASGTIENATTSDLIAVQSSNLTYGENCSLSHSLSVANISSIDTTVNISVIANGKEKHLNSGTLHPGETLSAHANKLISSCSTNQFAYHVTAFGTFVDETYSTPVDAEKLKASIKPDCSKQEKEDADKGSDPEKPDEKKEEGACKQDPEKTQEQTKPAPDDNKNGEMNQDKQEDVEKPEEKTEDNGVENQSKDESKSGDQKQEGAKESISPKENSDQTEVKTEE